MQSKPTDVDPFTSAIIGALAAVLSNFTLYPLDLIKVKIQAQAYREILVTSRFHAFRTVIKQTWTEGGLKGFYVGLTPGLVGPTAAWASYMLAYKWGQQHPILMDTLGIKNRTVSNLVAGMQAGFFMTLVTNPIFVIKTRMQTASPKYDSIKAAVRHLMETDGWIGFYRGFVPALPLITHGALHWMIYEEMKAIVLGRPNRSSKDMNNVETLLTTSSSKILAALCTYPLHVLKTCLQSHQNERLKLRRVIVDIYKLNGWRGFYAGLTPHLLRTVPNATVTMFFIEHLTQAAVAIRSNKSNTWIMNFVSSLGIQKLTHTCAVSHTRLYLCFRGRFMKRGFTDLGTVEDVGMMASPKRPKTDLDRNSTFEADDSTFDGLPKDQVVRLMLDSLTNMGFSAAAKALSEESNIPLESDAVTKFKHGILTGQWETVEALIPELNLPYEDQMKMVRFEIGRQKFMELLESMNVREALSVLRNELTPLGGETDTLHTLSTYFLFLSPEELRKITQWDGAAGNSRKLLLKKLHKYIPPSIMVPTNRLATLLKQSLQYQQYQCTYHNPQRCNINLFEDHICHKHAIPWECDQVVREHKSEVYHAAFSHSGTMLASCSEDGVLIIWTVTQELHKRREITLPDKVLTFVAWSPDDKYILACAEDMVAVWCVETGDSKCKSVHKGTVSSAAWTPDGRYFIAGGLDGSIVMYDLNGERRKAWQTSLVNDLVITPNGEKLIFICQDRKVSFYNLKEDTLEYSTELGQALTSLSISNDGNYLLITTSSLATPFIGVHPSQDIVIFDLQGSHPRMVEKVSGVKQSRFVIRACFGDGSNFIASGSEDAMIYLWHRASGELIARIGGHTATVNSVAWHPTEMKFVSTSDDKTIRLFSAKLPTKRNESARPPGAVENGNHS